MHKATQEKQRLARDRLSSLGLNDDESDRANRYIALHVRYARSQGRVLLPGILAVLAAFALAPMTELHVRREVVRADQNDAEHVLARMIGIEPARKLSAEFGGMDHIDIPRAAGALLAVRNKV
ncbi:hypothetical protein GTP55_13200 [Duganella sp. FT109W]|uniref:DUF3619 family protein n=1 Tax=Duganella margarita TaxID=2692170 RepID=A0ABW9WGS9_9BURK|nr:hypothetical protein [Duganella margarita]MYN40332.1 hypothetical protein [Duganella margarita]